MVSSYGLQICHTLKGVWRETIVKNASQSLGHTTSVAGASHPLQLPTTLAQPDGWTRAVLAG